MYVSLFLLLVWRPGSPIRRYAAHSVCSYTAVKQTSAAANPIVPGIAACCKPLLPLRNILFKSLIPHHSPATADVLSKNSYVIQTMHSAQPPCCLCICAMLAACNCLNNRAAPVACAPVTCATAATHLDVCVIFTLSRVLQPACLTGPSIVLAALIQPRSHRPLQSLQLCSGTAAGLPPECLLLPVHGRPQHLG